MNDRQRASLRQILVFVAILNFAVFLFVDMNIGGDALNGRITDGHYFLSDHGRLTEVSRAVFEYSAWHARSVLLTSVVALAAGVLLMRRNDFG